MMSVSTEWYGIPCGLKYPLAGSFSLLYMVRKRWVYSPFGTAAATGAAAGTVTVAGCAAPTVAAIAGCTPQMARSDAALMVAVATQADRRRVDEDIIRTFLAVGLAPRRRGHDPALPRAIARERDGGARRNRPPVPVASATVRTIGFRPGRRPLSGGAQAASRLLNASVG